jgi:hypothetical protein
MKHVRFSPLIAFPLIAFNTLLDHLTIDESDLHVDKTRKGSVPMATESDPYKNVARTANKPLSLIKKSSPV